MEKETEKCQGVVEGERVMVMMGIGGYEVIRAAYIQNEEDIGVKVGKDWCKERYEWN
jgi:hypothetical protein